MGEPERAHFAEGVMSMTYESEFEHLMEYLMAGGRSTEKYLNVIGGSYFCLAAKSGGLCWLGRRVLVEMTRRMLG